MSSLTAADPVRCPLCGQPNRCAMEIERGTGVKQPPCWCTQVTFGPATLDRIPPPARRQACVCRACAREPAP
ncbi:cysteine-rich CWC family protein [Polaromonas sp.]|uniref:cysteine-rich CWC family protein n=1 Tax=Polaromonas sp. TaxID=1869339 RepID=UPI002869EE94|nr:cysteine-rich CWC family protein [Polaromonas sp.]